MEPKLHKKKSQSRTFYASVTSSISKMSDVSFFENRSLGWKYSLLLQFQIEFRMMLEISSYISLICVVLDACFALGTNESIPYIYTGTLMNTIYLMDVLYFIDTIQMIIYKGIYWPEIDVYYVKRHSICILLDVASLIPIDYISYFLSMTSMRVIYLLRLRYVLRLNRIIMQLRRSRDLIDNNNLAMAMVDFLLTGLTAIMLTTFVYYLIDCNEKPCSYPDWKRMQYIIYRVCGVLTGRIYASVPLKINSHAIYFYVIMRFIAYMYTKGFIVGMFVSTMKQRMRPWSEFIRLQNTACAKIVFWYKADMLTRKWIRKYYEVFWMERRGIDKINMTGLPEALVTEINLELSWYALKHSHLFKNEDLSFLRHLSAFVKHDFMMQDEVIFKKGNVKDRMVYIISGVIQILSEKDNETPVMSLSGGTCIGEASLFLSYMSTCTVVCQSYCEVEIIERANFIKVIRKYPETYRKLRARVIDRCKKAKEYVKLSQYQIQQMSDKVSGNMTFKWIKITMKRLLSDEDAMETYMKSLSVESRLMVSTLNDMMFCADYLDLMVLTDQIVLVTDSVFLRATCPCILQPNSTVLPVWNAIITVALIFLVLIYPYYVMFKLRTTIEYYAFMYGITLLWCLDVYCQLSTAIKTKDTIYATMGDIALKRVGQINFIVDLFAAVPFEIFMIAVGGRFSGTIFKFMQCNRLFKALKFRKIFSRLEENVFYDLAKVRYFKYIFYMVVLSYCYAAFLSYLVSCLNETAPLRIYLNTIDMKTVLDRVCVFFYMGVNLLLDFSQRLPDDRMQLYLYVPICIIAITSVMFCIFFISDLTAIELLAYEDRLKMHEYVRVIKLIIAETNIHELEGQIMSYLETQWSFNRGSNVISYERDALENTIPDDLYHILRNSGYGGQLRIIPFFQELPDSFIKQLSVKMQYTIIPPGHVITYAGEVSKEMYAIWSGFCVTISNENLSTVLGPGQGFAMIETYMQVPIANSTITLTHCLVISCTYQDFMAVVAKYPDLCTEKRDMEQWFMSTWRHKTFKDQSSGHLFEYKYVKKLKTVTKSFRNFAHMLSRETESGMDYYGPFDALGFFQFVRYLLLKQTVICHGLFLKWWEIGRILCAFLSNMIYPIPAVYDCTDCFSMYLLYALDVSAWVDIYVRHHVSYFNDEGLEVTHPLKTATWYWKHSFVIDLLGVLPLYTMAKAAWGGSTSRWMKIVFRANHILQAHRIAGFFNHYQTSMYSNILLWTTLKFIFCGLILISYMGSILNYYFCDIDKGIKETPGLYEKGIHCDESTWPTKSSFGKPYSPMRIFFYWLYYTAAQLAATDLLAYTIKNVREDFTCIIIAFVGFIMFEFASAKIIAVKLASNSDLTFRQEEMRILLRFISNRNLDPRVTHEIVDHFELKWKKKKGRSYRSTFERFNSALEEDALFLIYGHALKMSTIFEGAGSSFCRSLLIEVRHEFFLTRGIISQVNDVNGKIFFIFKGQVEVLGPDYNRLLILPEGSLFGNLDEVPLGRRTLTMVAKGHVEILVIESGEFFKILSNYNVLYKRFRRLTAINTDYLAGGPLPPIVPKIFNDDLQAHSSQSHKRIWRDRFVNCFFYFGQTTKMKVWQMFYLIVVCYVGFNVELYQKIVRDTGAVTIVLYIFDVLCLINIYVKFRLSYEDENGNVVAEPKKIARHYMKMPYGFYFDLASVFPLEIFALCAAGTPYVNIVWCWCRANRLIRICFVIHHISHLNQRLNINVNLIRIWSTIVWISVCVQMSAALLIVLGCVDPAWNMFPLLECHFDNMTSYDRFRIYFTKINLMMLLFTGTPSELTFPNANHVIILTSLLMLGSRFSISFFMAQSCALYEVNYHRKTVYEEYAYRLKAYLEMQSVAPSLITRAWRYVCLLYTHHNGIQVPYLLNEAPYYLKEAVLNSLFGYHIRNHPVLKQCHVDLVRQMAANMENRVFFPGDYVAFRGDMDECMYFVHEGLVCALTIDNIKEEKIDHVVHTGEMFGLEQGLFEHKGHEYTYRVKIYTVIVILKRSSWIHLLNFFPASRLSIYEHIRKVNDATFVPDYT